MVICNFLISNFWLTNFTVEIAPDQKLLSQIWQSELLMGHYLEITEPVNVFGMQSICNSSLRYGSVMCIITLKYMVLCKN